MPRRETNWKPDVYDLATEVRVNTSEIEPADEVDEIDVQAEPVSITPLVAALDKDQTARVVIRYQQPSTPKSNDFYLLGGMIAGAVVGALFGLFKAPARGEETRNNLTTQARLQLEQGVNQASSVVNRSGNGSGD